MLAKQLNTERVNRPTLDQLGIRPEKLLETMGDFASCLVGESEGADTGGIDSFLFDEKADALDEAVSLSGTRPRKHEQRSRLGLDRLTLRFRCGVWGLSGEILNCGSHCSGNLEGPMRGRKKSTNKKLPTTTDLHGSRGLPRSKTEHWAAKNQLVAGA